MLKGELVSRISKEVSVSREGVEIFLRGLKKVLDAALTETALDDAKVHVPGVGKFYVKTTKPRPYRVGNGKEGVAPATAKIIFRPDMALREHVAEVHAPKN